MSRGNRSKDTKCDYLFKFVILGDSAVGKTNLLLRFTDAEYKPSHIPTIGVDFKIKIMQIDGKNAKLQLWDTAGQQRFKTITQTYYKGASGIVLVYSVGDRKSFTNITCWMNQIQEKEEENTPKLIVGNKSDLGLKDRQVSESQGRELAQKFGVPFLEASAKTGNNVNLIFEILAREVVNYFATEGAKQESTMNTQLTKRKLQEKKKKLDCCPN